MKLIVIGCARSGTGYISTFFKANGLDVGHEVEGKNGTSNHWKTFQNHDAYDFVLHQVRHPLKTIASALHQDPKDWDLLLESTPQIRDIPDSRRLERLTRWWIKWNTHARIVAQHSYRIEALEEEAYRISKLIGHPLTTFPKDKQYNHHNRTGRVVTLEEIEALGYGLAYELVTLARKFGYDLVHS